MTVPNPKDELNPINAPTPLPYEMMMATPIIPQPTPIQSTPQAQPVQPLQLQAQQQVQQNQSRQKELNKIKRKALIGAFLLLIPLVNLVGVALLVDALIHYLKLRSRS